tara:strand:- start:3213 stop:3377 length:165 start_codon:yes stop_codon:yes gene_type:complete
MTSIVIQLYNAKHVPIEALNSHKTLEWRVVDVALFSRWFLSCADITVLVCMFYQ